MNKVFSKIYLLIAIVLPLLCINGVAMAVPVNSGFEKKLHGREGLTGSYKEHTIDDISYWELPSLLKGVSGIKYLGDNRFACIQDEKGSIYIYNTALGEIEKEIPFSGPGDFEGIAIAGPAAYVVKSDGKIFEVQDYLGAQPVVHQYNTHLTAKHNVEGLTYDKSNNRLLLAVKGMEPCNNNYKCVYAFDLQSKRLAAKPVVKINLKDPFFIGMQKRETNNAFQPSAIEIHPVTGDLYILQGADPKLLVMDAKGHIKKLYTLNRSQFPQPEGLAFTPEGELFVSNEGKEGAATIVELIL